MKNTDDLQWFRFVRIDHQVRMDEKARMNWANFTLSLPTGSQESRIMAAKPEETVQKDDRSFVLHANLRVSRAPRPGALVAVFGAVLFPLLAFAAQSFTLFGRGCFFAFERLARLLAAPAFRLLAPAARTGPRDWGAN
jgi:hypothetical protein